MSQSNRIRACAVALTLAVSSVAGASRESEWLTLVGPIHLGGENRAAADLRCVVEEEPALAAARLDLGAALAELEPTTEYYQGVIACRQRRLRVARAHFEAAARGRPDERLGQQAEKHLALIAEELAGRTMLHAAAALQFDSNVSLSNDLIDQRGSGEADLRLAVHAGASIVARETAGSRARFGYDFFRSLHAELGEFDISKHHLWGEFVQERGSLEAGIGVAWDYYVLANRSLLGQFLLAPFLAVELGSLGRTELRYRWRRRAFHLQPFSGAILADGRRIWSRDATTHTLGLRHYLALGGKTTGFLGISAEKHDSRLTDPASEAFSYDGIELDCGLEASLSPALDLIVELDYRDEKYDDSSRMFSVDSLGSSSGQRRVDEEFRGTIALRRDLDERTTVTLSYLGVVNRSDDARFDYDRHIGSLSLEHRLPVR